MLNVIQLLKFFSFIIIYLLFFFSNHAFAYTVNVSYSSDGSPNEAVWLAEEISSDLKSQIYRQLNQLDINDPEQLEISVFIRDGYVNSWSDQIWLWGCRYNFVFSYRVQYKGKIIDNSKFYRYEDESNNGTCDKVGEDMRESISRKFANQVMSFVY